MLEKAKNSRHLIPKQPKFGYKSPHLVTLVQLRFFLPSLCQMGSLLAQDQLAAKCLGDE